MGPPRGHGESRRVNNFKRAQIIRQMFADFDIRHRVIATEWR